MEPKQLQGQGQPSAQQDPVPTSRGGCPRLLLGGNPGLALLTSASCNNAETWVLSVSFMGRRSQRRECLRERAPPLEMSSALVCCAALGQVLSLSEPQLYVPPDEIALGHK